MNRLDWLENVQTGLVRLSNEAARSKDFTAGDLALSAAGVLQNLIDELKERGIGDVQFENPPRRPGP